VSAAARQLDIFIVAGEPSGDVLAAGLMRALQDERPASFRGVGGAQMIDAGLATLYPMHDINAMGVLPVLAKLPTIVRRLGQTVHAIVANPPDLLLLVDAPDFTHRVAHRLRRRLPHLPIVKYVSPTVWMWRPGRARAMRPSIDLVLALLPFEPEVHRRLGGPPCVYVGHPLLEQLEALRPTPEDEEAGAAQPPLVLALPGSRRQEIHRHMSVFGEALRSVVATWGPLSVALPTPPGLAEEVAALAKKWPVRPRIITDEGDKRAAFRQARAALAVSGTVTLELALAGVPTVAAYQLPAIDAFVFRNAARVHDSIGVQSVILPNLILGERVVPEFLYRDCTAENLAAALADILDDSSARRRQLDAFRRLDNVLGVGAEPPRRRAARAVLELLAERGALSGKPQN
jgi:lipid-A-disaccharide synthase